MYEVTTNFGVYTVKFMPNVDEMIRYFHKAGQAGISPKAIQFKVRELPSPTPVSISQIIADIKP